MASHKNALRDTVMKSLMAVGSSSEAEFYTSLFQEQEPEKFAFIVVDPRCLHNPLIEALVSDFKILSDLGLTPIILIGAFELDRTKVRFQAQRLCKELEGAGIRVSKLNCASYELLPGIRRIVNNRRFAVLEMTEPERGLDVAGLVGALKPAKVIFLQPSGGLRRNGKRIPVVNIDRIDTALKADNLSQGQERFVEHVKTLSASMDHHCTYVIASPLNLLGELFTIKGSGTMFRNGAKVKSKANYRGFSKPKITASMESAFGRPLDKAFFKRDVSFVCLEDNYRAGAIVTKLAGLPYLSKFWVTQEAQGEGIARDIWQDLITNVPAFFWRSRNDNPFNDWYIKTCHGMQVSGGWRVFWIGLEAPELPGAILAAANAPHDFEYEDTEGKEQ